MHFNHYSKIAESEMAKVLNFTISTTVKAVPGVQTEDRKTSGDHDYDNY